MSSPWLWAVTTYPPAPYLKPTLASIPKDEDRIIIDVKELGGPLAKGWNKALKTAFVDNNYESVIICNDDIVVRPNTGKGLHVLRTTIGQHTDCLMTTAYDVNLHKDEGMVYLGALLRLPGMFCFCVGKDLIEQVGWFDEGFENVYEDTDMLHRIVAIGKMIFVVAPIEHVSAAFWTQSEERMKAKEAAMIKNHARYVDKWGGPPGKEVYSIPFDPESVITAPAEQHQAIKDWMEHENENNSDENGQEG